MIRDQIVVGLQDSNLSEGLQTDPELTLDKVIMIAWGTKAARDQQAMVRGETDNACTRIEVVEHNYSSKQVDILISKNQALQILYLKHCVYNNETT